MKSNTIFIIIILYCFVFFGCKHYGYGTFNSADYTTFENRLKISCKSFDECILLFNQFQTRLDKCKYEKECNYYYNNTTIVWFWLEEIKCKSAQDYENQMFCANQLMKEVYNQYEKCLQYPYLTCYNYRYSFYSIKEWYDEIKKENNLIEKEIEKQEQEEKLTQHHEEPDKEEDAENKQMVMGSMELPLPLTRNLILAEQLRNASDFRVRVQAALALGASKSNDAVSPLCDGLGDANATVRTAATRAIERLRKQGGVVSRDVDLCLEKRAKAEIQQKEKKEKEKKEKEKKCAQYKNSCHTVTSCQPITRRKIVGGKTINWVEEKCLPKTICSKPKPNFCNN